MKIDTITIIASGALLALALVVLYAGYLRRRHHVRRLLVTDLLRDYFRGHMPAPQLKRRTKSPASISPAAMNSMRSLFLLFKAADSALAPQAQSKQSQRKLLNAMANLKQEFGLTDRYQIEAWRPGRE